MKAPPLSQAQAEQIVAALGAQPVSGFADLTGRALPLAKAIWDRWKCPIGFATLGENGIWKEDTSAKALAYLQSLAEHGVPSEQRMIIRSSGELRRYDVIANLEGFGDRHRIGPLGDMLPLGLTPESRVVTDIRKGSGSYPVWNAIGTSTVFSTHQNGGKTVTRAIFNVTDLPDAGLPVAGTGRADADWAAIAATLHGPDGFYRADPLHSFLFIPRGQTLVVTFDNLDIAMTKREDRRPWGFGFIEKQGWSMLGVMAAGWTWYRDPWVDQQFDDLANSGFFKRFDRVVFYGASMGGYAACAFSRACPGADVVAISPQSTLDRRLVPWETRYKVAWASDFGGKYGDAAEASSQAGRVSILFDPYEPLDAAHVARFEAENVHKLRAPLLGHRLGSSLLQMGILQPIILGSLNGSLTDADFYRLLRARRSFARYQRELYKRALSRGRPMLARRVARWAMAQQESRFFRKALASLSR